MDRGSARVRTPSKLGRGFLSAPDGEHESSSNAVKFHKAELRFFDKRRILRGAGRLDGTQRWNGRGVVTTNSRTRPRVRDAAIETRIQRRDARRQNRANSN